MQAPGGHYVRRLGGAWEGRDRGHRPDPPLASSDVAVDPLDPFLDPEPDPEPPNLAHVVAQVVDGLADAQPWRGRAACRGMGTDAFLVSSPRSRPAVVDVCEGCEVRGHCLREALDFERELGNRPEPCIRGGLLPSERQEILGKRTGTPRTRTFEPRCRKCAAPLPQDDAFASVRVVCRSCRGPT